MEVNAAFAHLDCLEMLVEVVSVELRAPNDSKSEESRDLSLLVLELVKRVGKNDSE